MKKLTSYLLPLISLKYYVQGWPLRPPRDRTPLIRTAKRLNIQCPGAEVAALHCLNLVLVSLQKRLFLQVSVPYSVSLTPSGQIELLLQK
jgi:hypothetical protein